MPACGQRAGFRFPVADDAGDDQIRIIEGSAVCMGERITELAALMDRAGRLRRHVAGDPVGPGELAKQPMQSVPAALEVRIDFGIGAFEIGMRDQPRPAVAGADDVDHVQVVFLDEPVEVHIEEVQSGGGAPMAEQPRLDVAPLERCFEQRIVLEIDLADRQVIGGAPIGIHLLEQFGRKRVRHGGLRTRRPSQNQSWRGKVQLTVGAARRHGTGRELRYLPAAGAVPVWSRVNASPQFPDPPEPACFRSASCVRSVQRS